MLSSISWQQYLSAVMVLTGSYYFYVVFRYYRSEAIRLFQSKKVPGISYPVPAPLTFDVIGKACAEDQVTLTDIQHLQFAADIEETKTAMDQADPDEHIIQLQSGAKNDLISDAAKLIDGFKDSEDKDGFISLLKTLVHSFDDLQKEAESASHLPEIISMANEKLSFPLTLKDLVREPANIIH